MIRRGELSVTLSLFPSFVAVTSKCDTPEMMCGSRSTLYSANKVSDVWKYVRGIGMRLKQHTPAVFAP